MALTAYTKRQLAMSLGSWDLASELVTAIDADGGGTNLSDALLWRLKVVFGEAHNGGTATLFKTGVDDDSAVSDFVADRLRMAFGAEAALEIDTELGA